MLHRPVVPTLAIAALVAGIAAPALALPKKGKQKVVATYVRPLVDASGDDARGKIKLFSKSKKKKSDERLVFRAKFLPKAPHSVFMESDVGSGSFVLVGELKGKGNARKLKLKTKKGDVLPFGVSAVEDLAGRGVQVRDEADAVVLSSIMPVFVPKGSPDVVLVDLVLPASPPEPAAEGRVELMSKPWKGDERFGVEAQSLPAGEYSVFVEEPLGSGLFEEVGDLAPDPDEPGQLQLDLRRKFGDPLPLGVEVVDELLGRAVEVRDSVGSAFLQVVLPAGG